MRKWLIGTGIVLLVLAIAAFIVAKSLEPRARKRVIQLLSQRFDSDVKIAALSLTLFPAAAVTVEGVELRYHHRTDVPPIIQIKKLSAASDIPSLVFGLQHDVSIVKLEGLRINIAAGTLHRSQFKPQNPTYEKSNEAEGNHLPFVVHRIVADGTVLTILPKDPKKDPLEWDIEKLTLQSVGPKRPMKFIATLTNAKPPGLIQSTGSFGPWQKEDPGGSAVQGTYTFRNADMGAFKGLAGILSSDGSYQGSLDNIDVTGTTDIPNFQVGDGGLVDLTTQFSATVDGTNGDTRLHPVNARFRQSEFVCNGGVVGTPGKKGKTVDLDVVAGKARMEDILFLVLKQSNDPPPLLGDVSFKAKMILPPGDIPVVQKLNLNGQFGIRSAEFTSNKIQDRLDQMSNRSRGLKGREKQDDVASNLRARFVLRNSVARFSHISFDIPGIAVNLAGSYGLQSEKVDFEGAIELQGKLSQMTTGWKSLLLRAADPFFRDNGRTHLNVKVGGTRSKPEFGLKLRGGKDKNEKHKKR
jgi:hypothetical protein